MSPLNEAARSRGRKEGRLSVNAQTGSGGVGAAKERRRQKREGEREGHQELGERSHTTRV